MEPITGEECPLTGNLGNALISDLPNLKYLKLEYNLLTGNFPQQLGEMTQLTRISLSGNGLLGTIPHIIAQLPELEVFEIDNNLMGGTVPSFSNNDGYMEKFKIAGNEFEGRLQDILLSMPPESLYYFDVGSNR